MNIGLKTVETETCSQIIYYWLYTGVLISPQPDEGGKKLMFLSEWREFPSALCLAEKKIDFSSRLDVVEIVRGPDMILSLILSWSG